MATIDIITDPGTTHIELLDNPIVEKWTTHFTNMLEKYPMDYHAINIPVFHGHKSTNEILQDIENLKNSIIDVNTLVNNFPFDPERVTYSNIFDDQNKGQEILNEIHRYFTTGGRTTSNGSGHWSDNFHSEFILSKEDEDKFEHCHALINDYVHEIDQSIMTPRKNSDLNNQIVNLEFSFSNQLDDCRFEEGSWVEVIEEDYLFASDSEEYDVWVSKDILGKDYIEAFYDHDDPSEWDVTSINGHSGRFRINVESLWYESDSTNNTIQQLIKREDFQNWLKEYNIEYVPEICGIPLGKVTSGREFLIRKYFKSVYKQQFEVRINV